MDKFKPQDMHSFYAYHFLQRMLHEVRVLLARENASNMWLLAEKADKLMSLHLPQQHDVVAAVQHDGPTEDAAAEADIGAEGKSSLFGLAPAPALGFLGTTQSAQG
jgi:hypothetical protein